MMLLQIQDVMPPMNEALSTLTVSAMVVSIIQWLKNATWIPFVDQHSAGINRAISWGAAVVTGTGIHYMYTAESGTLILSGLTIASISTAIWNTLQSYFSQWFIYNLAIKPRAADVAAAAEALPDKPVIVATPGVAAAAAETHAEGVKP